MVALKSINIVSRDALSHVGIENLYCESEFESDTAENHAWDAITFNKIEQGWIQECNGKIFWL